MAAIRMISSCIVTVSLMVCCLGMDTDLSEVHPREVHRIIIAPFVRRMTTNSFDPIYQSCLPLAIRR